MRKSSLHYYTQPHIQKKRLRKRGKRRNKKTQYFQRHLSKIVFAPNDFRIMEAPEECIKFFNKLRDPNLDISYSHNRRYKKISLYFVTKIDFTTLSVLKCIFNELSVMGVLVDGDKPLNEKCRRFLDESGFLNGFYTNKNQKINPKVTKGKMFSFSINKGKMDEKQLLKFDEIAETAFQVKYGTNGYIDDLACVLKEIGGNSLEWSKSINVQWQLGIYENDNEYQYTVIDLGLGIIETINRRKQLFENLIEPNYNKILLEAFEGKYGSRTRESNRNNGLPLVKRLAEEDLLENLSVLSNNGLIKFNDTSNKTNKQKLPTFGGTLYFWRIQKNQNEERNLFNK